jgi:hypothetical protein
MASKHRQHVLADHVCKLVEALTEHRRGSGPHWLMVSEIEACAPMAFNAIHAPASDLQDRWQGYRLRDPRVTRSQAGLEHWQLAHHFLHEASDRPKDEITLKLAEAAFQSALKKERWLA